MYVRSNQTYGSNAANCLRKWLVLFISDSTTTNTLTTTTTTTKKHFSFICWFLVCVHPTVSVIMSLLSLGNKI